MEHKMKNPYSSTGVPDFPYVKNDPDSKEYQEKEKFYAECQARLAKYDADLEMRIREYRQIYPDVTNNPGKGPRPFPSRNFESRYPRTNVLVSADETPTEKTIYIIQDWIPEGAITLLVGPPNSGKNTIVNAIAAALSQGVNFPLWQGVTPNGSGETIISSTEEKFASTSKHKFIAAGGITSCFYNLNGIPAPHPTISGYTRPCNFSDADYAILHNSVKNIKSLSLLILDPVSQVINGNSGNNAKDRNGYERLAQFAEEQKLAVFGIAHTPKTTKGKGIYARLAGSGAAGQVARSIIMVTEIKGGPMASGATHIMVLAKASGKPVNYGVTYRIVGCDVADKNGQVFETSKIVWHENISGTPEELLLLAESGEMPGAGKVDPVDAAIEFLKETLQNGPMHGKEVEKLAKAAGITTRNLAQAKKTLEIWSKRREGVGQFSVFDWSLPATSVK
jgi:energy-coupling factor transporter ATP-binding protein EcfA2